MILIVVGILFCASAIVNAQRIHSTDLGEVLSMGWNIGITGVGVMFMCMGIRCAIEFFMA
jgi:hypothetical protein